MEFQDERDPPMASQRGGDGDTATVAPPPPIDPSAQGGGGVGSSAQGATEAASSSDQGVVVPPDGTQVGEGDQREGGEEEEQAEEGGIGGGEVAATPLDDLNIQWTTSTSGSGEEAMGTSGSGGVGGSGGGESNGADGSDDEPKGKRVAKEEPVREPEQVGISLGDYAIHAYREDVVAIGWEAPGVLNVVREEVVGQREAEMAALRRAELEAEAEAEEWIREAEEEEAELELRMWEDLEVAQGPRVSVVQEAAVALAERPRFDEATYDPPVHPFIPSGIDAYVSQQVLRREGTLGP